MGLDTVKSHQFVSSLVDDFFIIIIIFFSQESSVLGFQFINIDEMHECRSKNKAKINL